MSYLITTQKYIDKFIILPTIIIEKHIYIGQYYITLSWLKWELVLFIDKGFNQFIKKNNYYKVNYKS